MSRFRVEEDEEELAEDEAEEVEVTAAERRG
jgi:hypothetical protein